VITNKTIALAIGFGSLLIIVAMIMSAWLISQSRKAKAAVTKDKEYGRLAEEYRRLSELAVTAQEHADLKLGEIHMGLRQLRDQLMDVQKILKDVE
jgi:flagellar basal body-associated protein FliL